MAAVPWLNQNNCFVKHEKYTAYFKFKYFFEIIVFLF